MIKYIFYCFILFSIHACVNQESDINKLLPTEKETAEFAYNGYLLYSDSAVAKVKLDYVVSLSVSIRKESRVDFIVFMKS